MMSETQKFLALDAMKHLQAELNTGNCDLIFEEASQNFRQQGAAEWRRECRLIKYDLGAWRSFQVHDAENLSGNEDIFILSASADFEKQNTNIRAVWTFDGQIAKLSLLAFEQDNHRWKHIPNQVILNGSPWVGPPAPSNGVIL
jgi:hypothetical protein